MIDWAHWHNEPFLVGGLIFLGWLYAVLAGPLRGKLAGPAEPYPRKRAIRFYSALLIFYIAVGSPLDQFGDRFLLSAHMLQHQLLAYPAALLFLTGLPDWMLRPVTRRPELRSLLRFLTNPVICGLVYCLVMSVWHFPFLYDWALQNRPIHILEHFMMFGASLFLWWPVGSPSRDFPPSSYAVQMFYYVAINIGMTPAFAYITFSPDVLYPTYEYAPRITWMTPADDQLLGGVMMELIGMTVMAAAFAYSFYHWYRESERNAPAPKKRGGPESAPAG